MAGSQTFVKFDHEIPGVMIACDRASSQSQRKNNIFGSFPTSPDSRWIVVKNVHEVLVNCLVYKLAQEKCG